MTRLSHPLTALLWVAPLLMLAGCDREDVRAHAVEITDPAQYIGGPAALAKVGDLLMYNDQIKVTIRNAEPSPGFGLYGGAILDVDLVRGSNEFDGQGNDRFGELFPMVNFVAPDPNPEAEIPGSVTIVSDGADGGPAIVRVEGQRNKYLHILKLLTDVLNADEQHFTVRTDYILHPGARYLEIVTEAFVREDVALEQGWPTETEWHELPDTVDPVDPFAQLVGGILRPIQAEGEDLVAVGSTTVTSESVDFAAAGVVAGHILKADDGSGGLADSVIAAVDGYQLTLEDGIDIASGGAYFRVLGDLGESGHIFGDFLFMGAKSSFFMPDDANPLRSDWNDGLGPAIGYAQYDATLAITRAGGSTFTDPMLPAK